MGLLLMISDILTLFVTDTVLHLLTLTLLVFKPLFLSGNDQ